MKAYMHSTACAALDEEDPRGCTCSDNSTSPSSSARRDVTPTGSPRAGLPSDERFYTALGVMSAAAIEAAFSGADGTLRDGPDDWHRGADARLAHGS